MHIKTFFCTIALLSCISTGFAQPAPAPIQKESIAVRGGTIHIGNGQVIQDGCLLFEAGKIRYVGTDLSKISGAKQQIDARGKHIYPGFIGTATNLGLAEIEQVKATLDFRELGSMNANVRALTSYNTDSKIIPTVRSNGMLLAQVIPSGGVISGQSSVMQLDAWNWEDAAFHSDEGIFLNWPLPSNNRGWWAEPEKPEANDRYATETAQLRSYFDEAFAYGKAERTAEKHLAFESMRGLWNGSKKLYIRAQSARAMIQAVQFAQTYGIKPVLVGGADAWRIVDFLKQHQVPVILSQVHSLPVREDEDYDQPYKNPKLLQAQGILFCLSMDGYWEQRNLGFQAGHATGHGLAYEEAVRSITLNPARILGIDDRTGSLEAGKDATFFISEGDALDMRGNRVIRAFIQGRDINLDNKQKELYRRYQSKYPSN